MIGEAAVHVEEELGGLDIQPLQQPVHHRSGGAVAGVQHNFDATVEIELRRDLRRDRPGSRPCPDGEPLPLIEIAASGSGAELPEWSRHARWPGPQTVLNPLNSAGLWLPVIMMAPSASSMDRRKIQQRRGNHADIGDLATGLPSSLRATRRAAAWNSGGNRGPD